MLLLALPLPFWTDLKSSSFSTYLTLLTWSNCFAIESSAAWFMRLFQPSAVGVGVDADVVDDDDDGLLRVFSYLLLLLLLL